MRRAKINLPASVRQQDDRDALTMLHFEQGRAQYEPRVLRNDKRAWWGVRLTNLREDDRAHESAAVSLRLVFGAEYGALREADAFNVRADYLDAFREDGCTVSQYRDRIGRGNLEAYARCIRGR